ncbi:hypothetical protein TEA_013130 [Camellia sinensis var. sinensis]|uniref:UDENN domain-containing protein n=1 Tax=Camellia sinensis var. sinensis TaxID=542762 RepID=A0A4S4DD05_CAMSN|nr:hypothetical protein TEA_013130 [Camellia sinensis var. sinensis]
MARIFEYFVVCGLGPEIRTLDGNRGFHGTLVMYLPSLLDQYPPSNHTLYPPPPPQLPTCVLPAGVEFYTSGFNSNDVSTFPRSYPIVLTEGDGSKIYVCCIAFRDPVCEDIAEAYRIPANSFADKCICLVSRSPSFCILRDALEELFALCFSPDGSRQLCNNFSKPLWDVIANLVSGVPLPTPGKDRVLFAIENSLLAVEVPPKDGLPHADISFQPLMQCLDVDNFLKLFTAVLLERRVLFRSNKYLSNFRKLEKWYSLLTLVSEAMCHLIYPFRWQHVYIPLLFFSGVDYIDAPTPYMMGLHSGVDTTGLTMDGVVVVDLEHNRITTSEDIPPIPEPEFSSLRTEIMKLLYPNLVGIDQLKASLGSSSEQYPRGSSKPWGEYHDLQLRRLPQFHSMKAYLILFMVSQFLDSQGFFDYLERGLGSDENNNNLLDKLQDAMGRGQNPLSILPSPLAEPEIVTISDSGAGMSGSGAKYNYDRFPSNSRTEEQEEKRKQILAAASGALRTISFKIVPNFVVTFSSSPSVLVGKESKAQSLSPRERAAERERMVLDIQVKLQGLWLRLLKLGTTDDPLSSFEYGTILALIESDAEGIGGSGFVECIREHIHTGWICQLTEEQFIAVKELLKTAISRATSRNDMETVRDALEVSGEMYKKDTNNVSDYVQRHLRSLSIWEELRSANYAMLVTTQLIIMASHMVAGLGLPDTDAWYTIETIAEKNNIGYKQIVHSVSPYGLPSPHPQDANNDNQQPAEASGVGRSWVQSMFTRDTSLRANSFSRVRKWTSDSGNLAANENGTPRKQDSTAGQKKIQTNVRLLRGHTGAVTALHCVTRREVWDLVGDREDAGFFISGSTDCSVKIWDPSLRGSELKATLKGHTGTVRAVSSDRGKVVSGSDDQSVIVWDKQTTQLLEELTGHDAQERRGVSTGCGMGSFAQSHYKVVVKPKKHVNAYFIFMEEFRKQIKEKSVATIGKVSCVRMLSGERVLTSAHDGTVKMWDVRTDTCVATVGRCSNAVLCIEYDDSTGILAAAGRDAVANIWDIRAGRQMHKLLGHTKWIRSIRMVGDTLITGSDDWTARMWSVSRGTCDAVLACHAGSIMSVDYSVSDKGIITGSTDGLIRFWENEEGGIRCVKNVTIHTGSVLSINAGEHWLGIGAADNSMSLFNRPQERFGGASNTGSKMAGWQLYRTPQKTVAVVRCVASDLERKRICSGGRNGLLRLWDATINI